MASKTTTRRFLAGSAALLVGAGLLTGCSAGGGGGGSDDGTLTLWQNSTTGPGQDFWVKAAADFTKANPDVDIDVQTVQNEDFDSKLQTALNSGDAPDVFLQRGGGKLDAMVKAGQVKDITDGISDDARSDIGEGTFDAGSIDGKVYSMPVAVLPGGFWYSQDVFAAAGITTPPTTMDELDEAVTALKDSGTQPVALGGKDAWPAAHWYFFFALRACSSDVLEKAATDRDFSDQCWVDAAQDLADFRDTEPFNEGFLTTAAQQGAGSSAGLIANKQAGMELMGAWDPGVIASLTPDAKPLPDLGWFPFPAIDGGDGEPGAIMGGVDGYSCSTDAPDSCVDFLNYLATPDVQVAYYKAFNAPPVNTVAQESVTEPYLQDVISAYNDAPFVSQWLDTVYGLNVGNAMNVAVVDLLSGDGTPEQFVEAVDAAAKKA
jgi:raffinose/stachyose/melibiose transport system substrate-binding protein